MKNNNEFLREHERKVQERQQLVKQQIKAETDGKTEIDGIMKKNVLSEDELIRLMREQVGGRTTERIGNTGNDVVGGIRHDNYLHDPMFSAGNNNQNQYDRTQLNVMWSSWSNGTDGIDNLFGFEDDPFDGPSW